MVCLVLVLIASVPSSSALAGSGCFDVVVMGATPGGVAAAVAAGREGRTVALLEPGQYVGGAMSGGLGQADYGMHAERVLGGISREFFERVAAKYGVPFAFPPDNQCSDHRVYGNLRHHFGDRFSRILSTDPPHAIRVPWSLYHPC